LNKIAEEEYKITGLSPTYAFAVTIINRKNEISATELSEYLFMAPSTITRFVDKLIVKGLAERKMKGKNSFVYPTEKSKALQKKIEESWENVSNIYEEKLGKEKARELLTLLLEVSEKL
jgi:MarR family transcriptional regulator, organic hydroperoxide resistance regulator